MSWWNTCGFFYPVSILYHFMRSRHRCCNVLYCQYSTWIGNTSLCGSQGHIICRMSLEISVYLSTEMGIIRVIYACSHHFKPVFNSDIPWPSVRVDGIVQIAPLSFQAAIPHTNPDKWGEVSCTLQWSLSGHQHVCISISEVVITQAIKANLK